MLRLREKVTQSERKEHSGYTGVVENVYECEIRMTPANNVALWQFHKQSKGGGDALE